MKHLDIKALSVNKAWRGGRRFRTKEYLQYESDLLMILPKMKIPDGKLSVYYEFGFSNKRQDYDGAIKQFQDILQKAYNFDDNRIYEAHIKKTIVKKGSEFIKFEIKELQELYEQ